MCSINYSNANLRLFIDIISYVNNAYMLQRCYSLNILRIWSLLFYFLFSLWETICLSHGFSVLVAVFPKVFPLCFLCCVCVLAKYSIMEYSWYLHISTLRNTYTFKITYRIKHTVSPIRALCRANNIDHFLKSVPLWILAFVLGRILCSLCEALSLEGGSLPCYRFLV